MKALAASFVARSGLLTWILMAAFAGGYFVVLADDPLAPAASLNRYDLPAGESVFALALRAGRLPATAAHDHVILFDTSASQAGAHRRQGLAVLDVFLRELGKSDRVRLFAVDIKATPLAGAFYAPQSEEMKAAVAQLRRIVPLGATDLQSALETALKSFAGDRGRSIVYIGDGMSSAKLMQLPDLRKLLADLRQARVPVNSFAVGPRTDLQLLGTLAEHTGGVVFVDALMDDSKDLPAQQGQKLAAAASAPVFYPERISLTPRVDKLLPEVVPPIRADRDAILLGKGRLNDNFKITVTDGDRTLEWTVKPAARQSGNTFLARLWEMAEQTDGLAIAVAGQELLSAARQEFEEELQQLIAQGNRAVGLRDLKLAEQIAQTVKQLDPNNVEAETIMNAVQRAKDAAAGLSRRKKESKATNKDDDNFLEKEPRDATKFRAEALRKNVLRMIDRVRKEAKEDPLSALSELKHTLTTVESSNDIDPDIRKELRSKVQAAIDELKARK